MNNLSLFLQQSGNNHSFDIPSTLPFSDYLETMTSMIQHSRIDLETDDAEMIIQGNAPFEYRPSEIHAINPENNKFRKGILLIHGLYECPYHMRYLAEFFKKEGFLVRSILLPGHGTLPGDLLEVKCESWISATQYGIDTMKNDVEELHIGGYSTGATLALHFALQGNTFKSLFLFAPAIRISPFALFARYFKPLSRRWPRAHWFYVGDNQDIFKYESYSFNSATQIHRLIQMNTRLAEKTQIDIPMFMVLTANDRVVNSPAALHYFHYQPHPMSKLIVYTTKPHINHQDERIIMRNSRYPALRILNFSHTCLNKSIDDPHYGKNGTFTKIQISRLNISSEKAYFGEMRLTSEKDHFIRLYYNPDLFYLTNRMKTFLENLPT